ncbi:orotidine-5'-phosphate decarboxylase [Microbacterium wangchenii]|uniref:orotidine-5'-phosphate decarboxylase n=1 Tax=Microbacterium wangchenii TaxID=2541726 RepID=UPI0011C70387|nr:orotidine-5'-phosphate decarboxylase [Microbacterium wangchenii]TXK20472.1 orotidine-5'-phosphate decarboxylase [Microbacterium wangchenii]
MSASFGERLQRAHDTYGPLCVGIDPHEHLLAEWGMDATAAATRDFGLRVIEAAAGRVGVVKPQVAFFERYGAAGFAALEDVLRAGREAGLLVIADAKRGDIGSTMDGYAGAWLEPGAPLEADALTVTPYVGVEALEGTLHQAIRAGKGVFVLAATSNPEARELQRADVADDTVAALVVDQVTAFNAATTHEDRWGSIGVVIGATVDLVAAGLGLHTEDPVAPILAPGFGAQGAQPRDLRVRFGSRAGAVLASESRSILSAGPDGLAARIDERSAQYREATDD